LAQRVEPTLDMSRLAAILTDRLMAIPGENALVSLPKITERMTARVSQRNPSPQLETTDFAAVANEVGHDLAGTPTQGHPHPALVGFLQDERSQLVQFQPILQLGLGQRCFHSRQLSDPALNPNRKGRPRNAPQTLDSMQTDPFQQGALNLLAGRFSVAALSIQGAIAPARFAVTFWSPL
jgi:hypothetical protein